MGKQLKKDAAYEYSRSLGVDEKNITMKMINAGFDNKKMSCEFCCGDVFNVTDDLCNDYGDVRLLRCANCGAIKRIGYQE